MCERKRELEAQHVRGEFDRGVEFLEFFLANLNRYGVCKESVSIKCVMLQSLTFCAGKTDRHVFSHLMTALLSRAAGNLIAGFRDTS